MFEYFMRKGREEFDNGNYNEAFYNVAAANIQHLPNKLMYSEEYEFIHEELRRFNTKIDEIEKEKIELDRLIKEIYDFMEIKEN